RLPFRKLHAPLGGGFSRLIRKFANATNRAPRRELLRLFCTNAQESRSRLKGAHMSYTAAIDRANPAAFLFVIDQSGSIAEKMETGHSKAQFVADVLNNTLYQLIIRCTRADGVRNYFDVGVVAYGDSGVRSGFTGQLQTGQMLHPISSIEASPLRVEQRTKRVPDGAGGLADQSVKFPVWFDP